MKKSRKTLSEVILGGKVNTVKENLLQIQKEIVPYTPNIIAVTKYFNEEKMREAYNAGLRNFGESKVLEAIEKINKLPKDVKENSKFHLIGHLQSNKVNKAVGYFDYIHSVDSLNIAQLISQRALELGIRQKVLIQVNNAGESQKFGFSKEELIKAFKEIKSLKGLEVLGLMNIAPLGIEESELRELFLDIKNTKGQLERDFDCSLTELSMGMSEDYKEAVVAGATMLRIGRKLFSK